MTHLSMEEYGKAHHELEVGGPGLKTKQKLCHV